MGCRIQPTYEELKLKFYEQAEREILGIQPTYEELKLENLLGLRTLCRRIQPTYEELKLFPVWIYRR